MRDLFLGYDPGGNDAHGVASILCTDQTVEIATATLTTVGDVVAWCVQRINGAGAQPAAMGVDTLTVWSTSSSGYRPADRALRQAYHRVVNSVVAPNSLYGAMPINGMAALSLLRATHPNLRITETHPKVLYFALTGLAYDFAQNAPKMRADVEAWVGSGGARRMGSEHEWDALLSAHAAREWHCGAWTTDLHVLPVGANEQLVWPIGPTSFAWPSPVAAAPTHVQRAPRPAATTTGATWRGAADALQEAGHAEAARAVASYTNAKGNHGGWDGWFKRTYPELAPVVFGDE
jgi:hypothetical protein